MKTDILKASIIAVLAASLMGATIYYVSPLAFEAEPPIPYVDLYTDRGGQGANVPSEPYKPGENVTLYALVSDGINPVGYTFVTFIAFNNDSSIAPVIARVSLSNASGTASPLVGDRDYSFRLSPEPTVSVGTWQVLATVEIKDKIYTDQLIFECSQVNP